MFNGNRKTPTWGSIVPACIVSHWNNGSESWDFPVDTVSKGDSLSHTILLNSFTNVPSLFEHESVRSKWANKKSAKSNNFGTKIFLLFQLENTYQRLLFYSQIKVLQTFEILNHCCTANVAKVENQPYLIFWNVMTLNVMCSFTSLSNIGSAVGSILPTVIIL